MLRTYFSNRLESLFSEFARNIAAPASGNPLVPELVVAERGMDRWLWQQLSEDRGIAANLDVQLPAGFVWRTMRECFPGIPRQSPYDRGALAWRLMPLLDPAGLVAAEFDTLRHYLANDDDQRKRFQLARRLSDLFDQYLVYRHDMILSWEGGRLVGAGADESWQADLWRRVVAQAGDEHRARLLDRFLAAARNGKLDGSKLPPRVNIFAVPALPPVYVAVLAALGATIDIDIYTVNPSASFWGDAIRPREQADAFARYGEAVAMHLIDADGSASNPLLANGGARIQQYFLDLCDHDVHPTPDLFVDPGDTTLLARLQSDIYHNVAPRPATAESIDASVQVHGCYSLLREVEVLHDRLLDAFQQSTSLSPHDVLVLTPDIDLAAPYIDAVFGTTRGSAREIPYNLTDVARRAEHTLVAAFRQLLALPESRLAASDVLGLLETPAIARRFGRLDVADLDTLRRWVGAAGIRWGLDGLDRAGRGLPAESAHTWNFGLARLFLGLTMPDDQTLVCGCAPYPDVEGSDGIVLGKLQSFVDRLESARKKLSRAQSAESWRALMAELLADFFEAADADEDRGVDAISDAAAEFLDEITVAGHEGDITPAVFRTDFEARLAEPAARGGLLRGGVTFARLTPARSLPFRMICLIGMNHDRFPHRQAPTTFDLVAAKPRRGDKSRRDDDRHLFLETLLSARECLYISYTDRSLRDSSPQQPSVVVNELIDAICGPQTDREMRAGLRAALVTQHPLQSFSTRQYDGADPRLFSYDGDWVPAADAARRVRTGRAAFCPAALPPAADDGQDGATRRAEIRLADLLSSLKHPARWFLEQRLGVFLRDDDASEFDDDEPFGLADDFAVNERWITAALDGCDADVHFERLRACGALPEGAFAPIDWRERVTRFAPLVQRLQEDKRPYSALPIHLTLSDGRHLVGRLTTIADTVAGHPEGAATQRLMSSANEPYARLMLEAWINHLVMCAVRGDGCETRIETANGTALLGKPPGEAAALLGELIALFDQSTLWPLRIFPKAAWAYVNADDLDKGMKAARGKWNGHYNSPSEPERSDRSFAVCFGHEDDPLDEEFVRLAEKVFGPVKQSLVGAAAPAPDDAGDDA